MIDKYGLPTKIIPIDAEKNDTRERYIDYKESKKPSYQHQTPKSISKNDNINELCKAFPAIAFYVFIPASALFSTIFPKYKIFIACVVFFLLNFISLSILQKLKKKAEAELMMSKFKKGCHVKTIGGIMGKVVAINDTDGTFILETGSNKQKCLIKFDKQAIYQVSEGKKVAVKNEDEDMFKEDDEVEETPFEEVVETAEVVEESAPVEE